MTEMVYGAVPVTGGEPVLPKWWRTVDKWSLSCILTLFAVGILLGLAASVPLAERNGLNPFHYVQRQVAFGGMALIALFLTSMMNPVLVRRLAVIGFGAAFERFQVDLGIDLSDRQDMLSVSGIYSW